MTTYQILKQELSDPVYTGKTDQQCFDLLTAKNITINTVIAARDIQKYLALHNKLLTIEASTLPSAKNANRMLDLFDSFTVSEQAVHDALFGILDALIADSMINNDDKTAILSMGTQLISRANQLSISDLKIGQIIKARK